MEKNQPSRREFLKYFGVAAGAVATGIGFENQARAEREKKDYEQIIAKILQEEFFWVENPEYANAEVVAGLGAIKKKIQDILKSKNPPVYIFGENHHDKFCEDFFLEVLADDQGAKTVAAEALDHPDSVEHNIDLLSTTSPFNAGYEQRLKDLLANRQINRVILQHPFDPASEMQTKVLPFAKEGRVHIVVGAAHALLAPGELPMRQQAVAQGSDSKLLKTPQQDYFFDLYREHGAVAVKFVNSDEPIAGCQVRIFKEILPALRSGDITVGRAAQFLKRQVGRYIEKLSSQEVKLVWQEDDKGGLGLLTTAVSEQDFGILKSDNFEALFNFPYLHSLLADDKFSYETVAGGIRMMNENTAVDFSVNQDYRTGKLLVRVEYSGKARDGMLLVDKVESFEAEDKNGSWVYQKRKQ